MAIIKLESAHFLPTQRLSTGFAKCGAVSVASASVVSACQCVSANVSVNVTGFRLMAYGFRASSRLAPALDDVTEAQRFATCLGQRVKAPQTVFIFILIFILTARC